MLTKQWPMGIIWDEVDLGRHFLTVQFSAHFGVILLILALGVFTESYG
jgi:hypothetical protein